MSDNLKVTAAAVVGSAAPASSWFFEVATPWLGTLLTLGQIGVAVITILYIYRKWRSLK